MSVNFEISETRIEVGEGYFTVRGISAEDFTFLTVNYLDDMTAALARHGQNGIIARSGMKEFFIELARDFPNMVTEIISRCAEATAPEDVDKFRRLSFVKQLEALKAIADLTVQDGGVELKKVTGFVASLLEANGLQPGALMTALQTIIEKSANPSPS